MISSLFKALDQKKYTDELIEELIDKICQNNAISLYQKGDVIELKRAPRPSVSNKLVIISKSIEIKDYKPYFIYKGYVYKKDGSALSKVRASLNIEIKQDSISAERLEIK